MEQHSTFSSTQRPMQTAYPTFYQDQTGMPITQWNAWLDDMSKQMAGTDLTRRRSGRRNGPWSSVALKDSVRSSTRVGKVTSAGSSPMSALVKRRISTSGASVRGMPSNRIRAEQSMTSRVIPDHNVYGVGVVRPTSWHPSSQAAVGLPSRPISDASYWNGEMSQWGTGYAQGMINPYINDPSTPSLYPCSGNISPIDPYTPLTTSFDYTDQDSGAFHWPDMMGPVPGPYTGPYAAPEPCKLPRSFPGQHTSLCMPTNAMNTVHSVPHSSSDISPVSYLQMTSSPTQNTLLPIQQPDPKVDDHETSRYHSRRPSEQQEQELVGMGLYDDTSVETGMRKWGKGRMVSSFLDIHDMDAQPVGKGLKLEETWTPPAEKGTQTKGNSKNKGGRGSGEVKACPEDLLGSMLGSSFLLDDGCFLDDGCYATDNKMALYSGPMGAHP